jgi:muramidase (phage lysozyme)
MNSAIAAASLLGFGDKPASEAIQGFTMTLNKMYETQLQSHRGEELSRKAVIDEYNKGQREKKRKEGDMMEMLSSRRIGGGFSGGSSGSSAGGGGGMMSKLLLGGAVALGGTALMALVPGMIFDSVKGTVTDMVDPIVNAFGKVFDGDKSPSPPTLNPSTSSDDASGGQTVVLAAGTNTAGDPDKASADMAKSVKLLTSKGYNVVVVPPNKTEYPEAHAAITAAVTKEGATIEEGVYDTKDPLHLTMKSAADIKEKYPNAVYMGDSNAARIAGDRGKDNVRREGAQTSEVVGYAESIQESPTTPTTSDSGQVDTGWSPVLELIAGAESKGRYDIVYGGKILEGITEQTIVEAAKRAGDRGDGKNYAVGKYQFITLVDQAKAAGLDPTKDKFSPANQDKIAIHLIEQKRKVSKDLAKNNPNEAALRLAKEWAGLPVLAPTKGAKRNITRGQSYYEGDEINKATITPEKVEAAFQKLQKGGRPDGKKIKSQNKFHKNLFKKIEQRKENQKKRPPRKDNGAESEQTIAAVENVQKRQKGGKIFLHWAGTPHNGSASPKYHATIMKDGTPKKTKDYNEFGGGHTSGRNSEGIGISLDAMGMFNGKWPNFGDFGPYAVKPAQYEGMAKLSAQILTDWGHDASYVTKENVQTHAEAANIGDSKGGYGPLTTTPIPSGDYRWDLWGLYENDTPGSGGNKIRNMIRANMNGQSVSEDTSNDSTDSGSDTSTEEMTPSTEGAVPGSPIIPTTTPTTIEGAIVQMATQLLAPTFGALAALSGNPLATTSSSSSSSSSPSSSSSSPTQTNSGSGASSVTEPNAKAILNAIADAEGTSKYPEQGYRTMFTGKQFGGDWKHPRQIQSSSGYSSDAAGRYQFLSTTWDGMGMEDFSPSSQDQAALKLLSQAGVNVSDGLSEQEIYKVGQKWASVEGGPQGVKGGSYGAQAKYSASQFMEMYKGYGGSPEQLQKGGTVGSQINSGSMRGSQNIQMTRLREAQQKMKRKGGPKIVQVSLPPMPPTTPPPQQGYNSSMGPKRQMTMSELSDYNRRLGIGALA